MKPITSLADLDLSKTYSYADYLTWRLEQAVEIIKGKILPMAAPSTHHQRMSRTLNGVLYIFFRKHPCEFFAAPFDVRLYDKRKSERANKEVFTVVQPDLCVICDDEKLDEKGCLGAPDLVVEILSPGNSDKEMRIKKQLYEENSVLEYWIFDPEREIVFQFALDEKTNLFGPPSIFLAGDFLPCVLFPDLKVKLKDVFAKPKKSSKK